MAKKTKKTKKTVDFDDVMNCVKYVGTQIGDRYLLVFDGIRKVFKDTDEVIPFLNERGYTVLYDGEEM